MKNITRIVPLMLLLFSTSCKKTDENILSSSSEIIDYSLKKADGSSFLNGEVSVDLKGRNINITVPSNTNRSQLVPTIIISGKSISPASGIVQNFTNPVTYTVTAENGDTTNYIVTVNILSSSSEIIDYSLKKADGSSFLSGEVSVDLKGRNINITVPSNTNRNQLVPTITISGKSISPASGIVQDFTNPVTYTVTAENGDTTNYIVTVNIKTHPAIVYFGCQDNALYALDAATGEMVWKHQGANSFVYSSPTYFNGVIYIGSIDNNVYAFDAATGTVKWKTLIASTGIESDAVFANGTVYVGTNDDYLYALDGNTGKVKWNFLTGGNISSSPVVLNQIVYFGSSDGKMYALSAESGQLKWSYQTGAMINQSGAAIVNGIIYVGSGDSYLYAIDANSGSLIWKYYANGISLEQSSPTVSNGIVYIGGWYGSNFTNKGSLYAINAQTGELVWEKLQNTGISSSPIVADGKLYITCDDLKIHALDALTGASLWSKEILPNSSSAAVYNGIVYVGGAGSWYFYAFDAATGVEKWKFNIPNGLMTSSPLVVVQSGDIYPSGDSGSMQ